MRPAVEEKRPDPILQRATGQPPESPPHPIAAIFTADDATGPDLLSRSENAAFLAELAAHRRAETPMAIGLFGKAGTGKSFFLRSMLDSVDGLTGGARPAGSYLPGIATVRIEARPGVAPATAIVRHLFEALATSHPQLVAEASYAGHDPRIAAREASERLNEARQRLDAERRTLDELNGRSARLAENVLFDTAGSRIDSYSRSNRARIERSLRRFGFGGEPVANYKDLVREASEPGGSLARGSGWLRVFWAYHGQTRLIVTALVLFAIAWGLGAVMDDQTILVDGIRSTGEKMAPVADWTQAHIHWLKPVQQMLCLAGLLALLLNLVRGIRFLQPIVKGASLLRTDIETRRRDLDSLLAHQTRRVDGLVSDADLASQQAADAEGRLGGDRSGGGLSIPAAVAIGRDGADSGFDTARAFITAIGAAMQPGALNGNRPAPSRIVIGVDGLDGLPSAEAASYVRTSRQLFDRAGFITIFAADRDHLATGFAETDPALATEHLTRLIQVPYVLAGDDNATAFARALVAAEPPQSGSQVQSSAASTGASQLDRPWEPIESRVVEALAPFAGPTPRGVKRFVNLYRIARADPGLRDAKPAELAGLAIGLALAGNGPPLAADAFTMPSGFPDGENDPVAARKMAEGALGASLDPTSAARGLGIASRYTIRS